MSPSFSTEVVRWQRVHGRSDLPWQNRACAYTTWLSEIMLQQTQVATVIGYFNRFIEQFPTVHQLAEASLEQVMTLWQGLGYYSRARNLHACAQVVAREYGGVFPSAVRELMALPGIGQTTAGAIVSLGHGLSAPILDGNVKRVYARQFGVEGYPERSDVKRKLWQLAETHTPSSDCAVYNQGLMDLGALVCLPKVPRCDECPVRSSCFAHQTHRVGELPSKKPKKEKLNWYFIALLLQDDSGAYLMTEQGENALWRGLWMPPFFQLNESLNQSDSMASWLLQFDLNGCVAHDFEAQAWVVHELTHRRMHFKCIRQEVGPGLARPEGFEFAGLGHRPVPSLFHKLIS